MNANANHTNYVAQNQIDASDAQDLQVAWTFRSRRRHNVPGLNVTGQGVYLPPLVVNGTVYVVTNYLTVYAINGETGDGGLVLRAELNTTGLPLGPLTGHMHGINYYRGDIWVSMPDCSVVALDALTGGADEDLRHLQGRPGERGLLRRVGGPSGLRRGHDDMDELRLRGDGRGAGLRRRLQHHRRALLWRWYVAPPAGGDPSWDSDSCPPSSCHGNVAPYTGDWGAMGMTRRSTAPLPPAGGGRPELRRPGRGHPARHSLRLDLAGLPRLERDLSAWARPLCRLGHRPQRDGRPDDLVLPDHPA